MQTDLRESELPTREFYHKHPRTVPLRDGGRAPCMPFPLGGALGAVPRQAHAGRRAVRPDSPCSKRKPDHRGCVAITPTHGDSSAFHRGAERSVQRARRSRVGGGR